MINNLKIKVENEDRDLLSEDICKNVLSRLSPFQKSLLALRYSGKYQKDVGRELNVCDGMISQLQTRAEFRIYRAMVNEMKANPWGESSETKKSILEQLVSRGYSYGFIEVPDGEGFKDQYEYHKQLVAAGFLRKRKQEINPARAGGVILVPHYCPAKKEKIWVRLPQSQYLSIVKGRDQLKTS